MLSRRAKLLASHKLSNTTHHPGWGRFSADVLGGRVLQKDIRKMYEVPANGAWPEPSTPKDSLGRALEGQAWRWMSDFRSVQERLTGVDRQFDCDAEAQPSPSGVRFALGPQIVVFVPGKELCAVMPTLLELLGLSAPLSAPQETRPVVVVVSAEKDEMDRVRAEAGEALGLESKLLLVAKDFTDALRRDKSVVLVGDAQGFGGSDFVPGTMSDEQAGFVELAESSRYADGALGGFEWLASCYHLTRNPALWTAFKNTYFGEHFQGPRSSSGLLYFPFLFAVRLKADPNSSVEDHARVQGFVNEMVEHVGDADKVDFQQDRYYGSGMGLTDEFCTIFRLTLAAFPKEVEVALLGEQKHPWKTQTMPRMDVLCELLEEWVYPHPEPRVGGKTTPTEQQEARDNRYKFACDVIADLAQSYPRVRTEMMSEYNIFETLLRGPDSTEVADWKWHALAALGASAHAEVHLIEGLKGLRVREGNAGVRNGHLRLLLRLLSTEGGGDALETRYGSKSGTSEYVSYLIDVVNENGVGAASGQPSTVATIEDLHEWGAGGLAIVALALLQRSWRGRKAFAARKAEVLQSERWQTLLRQGDVSDASPSNLAPEVQTALQMLRTVLAPYNHKP